MSSFHDAEESRQLDVRAAEDERMANRAAAKALRSFTEAVRSNAPSTDCIRSRVWNGPGRRAVTFGRCKKWKCRHCAEWNAADILEEILEQLGELSTVYVHTLGTPEDRSRFQQCHNKRRSRAAHVARTDGAHIIPIAGDASFVLAGHPIKDGQAVTLADGLAHTLDALRERARLARSGVHRNRAVVGELQRTKPPVAFNESEPIETHSTDATETTEQLQFAGLMPEAVTAGDVRTACEQLNLKLSHTNERGAWEVRGDEHDIAAFDQYLIAKHRLRTTAQLSEGRAHNQAKRAWENQHA